MYVYVIFLLCDTYIMCLLLMHLLYFSCSFVVSLLYSIVEGQFDKPIYFAMNECFPLPKFHLLSDSLLYNFIHFIQWFSNIIKPYKKYDFLNTAKYAVVLVMTSSFDGKYFSRDLFIYVSYQVKFAFSSIHYEINTIFLQFFSFPARW